MSSGQGQCVLSINVVLLFCLAQSTSGQKLPALQRKEKKIAGLEGNGMGLAVVSSRRGRMILLYSQLAS